MLTRALRAKTLKEEEEGDRLTYFLILFPTVRHPNLRGEPCAADALTGASPRVCSYRCLTEVSKHNIFYFFKSKLTRAVMHRLSSNILHNVFILSLNI